MLTDSAHELHKLLTDPKLEVGAINYINKALVSVPWKKRLKKKSDKKKNALILRATPEQLLAIVEICLNILRFNFPLNKRQRLRLSRYADYYRQIARARSEQGARRQIVQQGSGIALASILVPVVSALAEQLLRK